MGKGKATGIGGIFFKSRNPEKIKDWYQQHFGLKTNEYGSLFKVSENNLSLRNTID
jgi:hypothetical protein